MADDAVINRIRKLLNLANDNGASEGEIENALKFAKDLMEKHDLAEAEDLSNPDTAPVVGETRTSIKRNEVSSTVMHIVCMICHCKFYISGKDETLVIYGYPRDVAIAKEMYNELFASVRAMVRSRYGLGWGPRHRDYCRGWAQGAIEKAQAPAAAGMGAIVLVRDAALDAFSRSKRLVQGRSKQITINDTSAYNTGRRDGSNVDLSRDNRLSNPTRRLEC